MVEVPRPPETRIELVVAGIDDEQIGAPLQVAQDLVLHFQRISRPGDDVEVNRPVGNRFLKLPGDDLADRHPAVVGNALGARSSHDDQIDRRGHQDGSGKSERRSICGKGFANRGEGSVRSSIPRPPTGTTVERWDHEIQPAQTSLGQGQAAQEGDAQHEPAGQDRPAAPPASTSE